MTRTLLPYERNHLLRHGFNLDQIAEYGEMPVEYITGWADFAGQSWHVTPDTLIPRPETEEILTLIPHHRSKLSTEHPVTWLELGTGSGALGLSWALQLASSGFTQVGWLLDISPAALTVAQQNFQRLAPQFPHLPQLTFLESDLATGLSPDQTFDVVLANLPYIPSQTVLSLDASVKEFEPHLALDGGPTGFELVAQALHQVLPRLNPGGQIWLEVDTSHTPDFVRDYWLTHSDQPWPATWQLTGFEDQFERHRFLLVEPR